MSSSSDAVALTRDLIGFQTVNPPGHERPLAEFVAGILSRAGFACTLQQVGDGRANLVARIGGPGPALAFTGHFDVVPLGAQPWSVDPFAGEIRDGRLYGRGSSDMKSGLAAFVTAATARADALAKGGPGVAMVVTVGEETGCEGALTFAEAVSACGPVGALVVGEPTGNSPAIGHKGVLWLKATTRGVTAHGAMPEMGVNAVYKIARAVTRLEAFDFGVAAHPVLGAPTLNVGKVAGGLNINSVPDRAELHLDVRTIPGMDHASLREALRRAIGEDAEIETLYDMGGIWTEPGQPWMARALAAVAAVTGEPFAPRGTSYFTDASVLTPALGGVPTLILGPGDSAMAHQTDESCAVARIEQAVDIYGRLIDDWRAAGP